MNLTTKCEGGGTTEFLHTRIKSFPFFASSKFQRKLLFYLPLKQNLVSQLLRFEIRLANTKNALWTKPRITSTTLLRALP